MEYREYLLTPEWYARRGYVMMRDEGECGMCGAPARDVHHLTYARIFREFPSDLMALCRACHDEIHKDDDPSERSGVFVSRERAKDSLPNEGGDMKNTSTFRRVIRSSEMVNIRESIAQLDNVTLDVARVTTAHHKETGEWFPALNEMVLHPSIAPLPIVKSVKGNVPQQSLRLAVRMGIKLAKKPEIQIRNRIEDYFAKKWANGFAEEVAKTGFPVQNMGIRVDVLGDVPKDAVYQKYHIELDSDELNLAENEAVMVITVKDAVKPEPAPQPKQVEPEPAPVEPEPEPTPEPTPKVEPAVVEPVVVEPVEPAPQPKREPNIILRMWRMVASWILGL